MRIFLGIAALLACFTLGACGGGGESGPSTEGSDSRLEQVVKAAGQVTAGEFPATRGRTLQQVADTVRARLQVVPATSTFEPGRNRIAFGLLDTSSNSLVYGKAAAYVARTPRERAQGPFPAPLDSFAVEPPFRSQTTHNDPRAVKAIYESEVPFPSPGRYAILVVTRSGTGFIGAPARILVERKSPIPKPGQRPPRISTPTVASVGGDVQRIDTRVPPDTMHDVDFKDVLGKRPVALLFATPRLCESRVCGPVVDIGEQLKATYGKRIAFIHQEVYVDNDVTKGMRPQLRAFHLESEPWLFTFDRRGRIAARLEGAFGIRDFRRAVRAALR